MENGKTPALVCRQVTKQYGEAVALNDFNFTAHEGRIVGLLGPFGCGKSTLLKMAAGIERLGSGELLVLGETPSHTLMSSVAYMPDRPNIPDFGSVGRLIRYFKDFFPDFRPSVIESILPELGITAKDKIRFLSPTVLRKLQLSLTMSRAAKLYLLDEPPAFTMDGSAEFISRVIMANCPESSTVVVASSQVADVEYILDDFFFITYGGRILLSGSARVAREGSGRSLAELAKEVY